MKQQTDEWRNARTGVVTASRFKDVLAKGRNNQPSKTRLSYMIEIATEILTGEPCEKFQGNTATEWGNEHECIARAEYELRSGNMVSEHGFSVHPDIVFAGASPDGLIGDDGGIEIKCPYNSAVHLQTLLNGMPPEHKAQVQGNMWVYNRQWWDFVSFDPRFPEDKQLYIERISRDDEYIKNLAYEINKFKSELDGMIEKISK